MSYAIRILLGSLVSLNYITIASIFLPDPGTRFNVDASYDIDRSFGAVYYHDIKKKVDPRILKRLAYLHSLIFFAKILLFQNNIFTRFHFIAQNHIFEHYFDNIYISHFILFGVAIGTYFFFMHRNALLRNKK